jgi:outer membrane lipoprotein-sorting protein
MKHSIYFKMAALFAAASNAAQAAPSAEELLRSLQKAEKSLHYSGTATITRAGAPARTIQVWQAGNKRRLEWTAPPVARGDLLINDGQNVWHYFRSEKSAVQTRGGVEIDWSRLSRVMNAKVSRGDDIAGREAWLLSLSPREGNQPPLKVWVDQKTGARLRIERGSGTAKTTMTLQKVQFGAVPAARFQWSPPSGARVTRTEGTLYTDVAQARRTASWLGMPNSLPPGYVFESAVVDTSGNGGKGEAWLRYANGINRFSIFQQRTGDNKAVPTQKAGSGWFSQANGNRFMVLGLSDNQARQVLESLK